MDTEQHGRSEFSNGTVVGESLLSLNESEEPVKRRTSTKPKKQKVGKRPKRASGKAPGQDKLVCRYCGSSDLSPSFKKRRDARCRACFAKRYSSKSTGKKPKRAKKKA